MLRTLSLSALLLGAAALPAQLGPQAAAPARRIFTLQPMLFDWTQASACPVQMRAQVRGEPAFSQARENGHTAAPRKHLHLTLSHAQSDRVLSVELSVQGLSNTPRVVPALAGAAPDLIRAFHVVFSPASETETVSDLQLEGFASVLRIRVDAITYADGRVEQIAPQSSCRFTPDLLVPVEANTR